MCRCIFRDKVIRTNASTPHNSSFDLAFCGNIALDTNRRLQYRSVYARLLLRHLKPTPCKGLTSDMSTGSPTLNSPAWLR